jgi:hypothetical protein
MKATTSHTSSLTHRQDVDVGRVVTVIDGLLHGDSAAERMEVEQLKLHTDALADHLLNLTEKHLIRSCEAEVTKISQWIPKVRYVTDHR